AWGSYLGYGADALGLVFAAAINQGADLGNQVFEILRDSAIGDHEIGAMGRHVTRALLVAERPEGWQLMENMLVAAQRQEGLRQVILETIDEAHPKAFQRMLRVILEQNLVRFSATIRAADVWFGLNWDVDQRRWVQESLEQVLTLLEEPQETINVTDEPQQLFLSLWVLAFTDVEQAIAAAVDVLQSGQVEQRFAAAYLLRQLDISESRAALLPSLADEKIQVAAQAFFAVSAYSARSKQQHRFEALEAFLQRCTEKEITLKPLVWPWMGDSLKQSSVADQLVRAQGERPVHCVLPYLQMMGHWSKRELSQQLAKLESWDDAVRKAIFGLLRDRSSYVREEMVRQLQIQGYVPSEAEATDLESLMTRKAADLRRGVISLLLKQDDADVVASAQRLLAASKQPQRLAGLELLDQLKQSDRVEVKPIAANYIQQRPKRTASEQELVDKLLAAEQDVPTLDDALGLAVASERTAPVAPQTPKNSVPLVTDSTLALLQSLDDLVDEHRATEVEISDDESDLLGNIRWWFPSPDAKLSLEENLKSLPLAEVWQTWLADHETQGSQKLELIRMVVLFWGDNRIQYGRYGLWQNQESPPEWINTLMKQWCSTPENLKYPAIVIAILKWLLWLNPPKQVVASLLNVSCFTLATIVEHAATSPKRYDWRNTPLMNWFRYVCF
ncbi:MAG: hypothetical protein AAFY17_13795, partial [Cyanobacteria bacterium J06642_11]